MTKTQAADMGKVDGAAYANGLDPNRLRLDYDTSRADFHRAATSSSVDIGVRSIDSPNAVAYIAAFVPAAMKTYIDRRNELPDVKAANRLESFNYALDAMDRNAVADIEKFKTRFAEDPAYAFEWADRAMEASAKAKTVVHVRALLERTSNDVDAVMTEITRKALDGARFPSSSTSQCTNMMHVFTTAAYAELVREF